MMYTKGVTPAEFYKRAEELNPPSEAIVNEFVDDMEISLEEYMKRNKELFEDDKTLIKKVFNEKI